jgi:chromosome partitioning protein
MGKIICVANQKGGVGKTTTAVNLGASIALMKKSTLVVDMDPQGNTTSGLGINKEKLNKTVYHTLISLSPMEDVILSTAVDNLFIAPANAELIGAEMELFSMQNREKRLKYSLSVISHLYTYILIDCPPSLGLLTLNAMAAAHSILVPIQCEYYAMEGVGQLLNTISRVRHYLNPSLKIEGFLLTMFDARNKLSHQVASEIIKYFKTEVFNTVIPRNVRLSEAPSFGQPVLLYDSASKGCQSYLHLAKEIINNGGV